ncbi:hypothetical protein [Clostridium tyrobutyricum]|uniref:hypothetical protein n=1 Tax=Clostridium tyrobutyricum TaxID=1519 RepID=UPI001C38EB68|nr:hypothetical protein [Clostridium tyrobutyricum]MBV4424929.1 hypothetical protein [Clostridium tyrobutyricum]
MSVDVSKECDFINQAILGGDVRKSLSGGIQKIADEVNKFEGDSSNQQNEFQKNITDQQNNYEDKITKQQNDYEDKITKQQNNYETDLSKKENDFEGSIKNEQQAYEKNITGRQDNLEGRQGNLEVRQTNLENTFDQEIENAVSNNPSSAETVYARTDHVNNKTYNNLGERLDTLMNQLGYIPVDGGSFFDDYIEFKKDGGTF